MLRRMSRLRAAASPRYMPSTGMLRVLAPGASVYTALCRFQ